MNRLFCNFSGSCVSAILLAGFLLPEPRAHAADDTFATQIAPFLKKHCQDCHGAQKQSARLRFDQFQGFQAADRNLWTVIHEKITSGEMPPKEHAQPTDAEKKKLLAWIEDQQRALGSGVTRRLNRREVGAALRDVTGLRVDFGHALPGDGTVAGFDTGADGLQDAADSVVQWMQVTRRAVDGVRFVEPSPMGKLFFANLREAKDPKKAIDDWKTDGATGKPLGIARTGMGLLLEPRAVGERDSTTFTVPAPADKQGVLRLRLVVSAFKPIEKIPNPRLWIEIGGRDIDFAEITGTLDKPQELIYHVHLGDLAIGSKGVTVSLANKVELPYAVAGYENEDKTNPKDTNPVPGGTGLFRPSYDRKTTPPEKAPAPFVVLQRIEIEPNYVAAWPPTEWNANIGKITDSPESAKKLLAVWMERAWRRPVTDAEQVPFFKLYEKLRREEMNFDAALRGAFQSVLMSAPFRYLAATSHSDKTIAQYAIASRLSFMFWSEPPDAELLKLAAAGKLRDPATLDSQVDRLLADSRSHTFTRSFVTQWLELEQPITIAQSHINKQDFRFARYLKASMKDETIAYLAQLIAENRPAREIVASDWTMMNDTLALHYGYDGIDGGHLRKVKLRANDPRGGGILSHAGIQSMLCWMGDNWVIYRGSWALRHILDHPPPPPPLEVPELNPNEGKNKGKPFRELLKQHQQDNRCSVCHKFIDPVGFAFQNFDISGRWRDVEYESYQRGELDGRIAWVGVGKTRAVDTTGQLPRGEKFTTFAQFKELVAKEYQTDLVRGLMKNFIVYATGRKPDANDSKEISDILKERKPTGYELRDLLKSVIRSRAFLGQ